MCACFSFRFWKDHHLRASKDFIIVTILTLRRKPFDHKFSTIFFMQSMFSADKKQHSTKKEETTIKSVSIDNSSMDGIYKIETYDKVPQTVTCLFLRFILRVLSGMSREDHDSVSLAFQVW